MQIVSERALRNAIASRCNGGLSGYSHIGTRMPPLVMREKKTFLTQMVRVAGDRCDFSTIDGDLLMFATIQAAGGVTNLLQGLFDDAIQG